MVSSKDLRSFTNSASPLFARRATPWLPAALSMIASMIHLWSFPDHFLLWWGYGAFFLAAALAQGLYAVALLRIPSRSLYLAGIWGNLSLIAFYVATRTAGIPLHDANSIATTPVSSTPDAM